MMILRQIIDFKSCRYSYLLGCEQTGQAALIDPILTKVDEYNQLMVELNLSLKSVLATSMNDEMKQALSVLKACSGCETWAGQQCLPLSADQTLEDGSLVMVGEIDISVIFTPGQSADAHCFHVAIDGNGLLFSGHTLLIRKTNMVDSSQYNASDLYESLHHKLMLLPGHTMLCPSYDSQGFTVSTMAEEQQYNPSLLMVSRENFMTNQPH